MLAITVKDFKAVLEASSYEAVSKEFGIPVEELLEINQKIESENLADEILIGWKS